MPDKKQFPENCADLQRMIETSKNGLFGQIKSTTFLSPHEEITIGKTVENITRITAYALADKVSVINEDTIISHIFDKDSYAARHNINWHRTMTFDEFRNSKFWEPTMEAFKDGDCDASAFSDFEASCDGEDGYVSMELELLRKNSFGNLIVDKRHDRFTCHIDRSAWISISCGDKTYDGDARELFKLIEEAQTLRNAGIVVSCEEITRRNNK